MNRVETSDSYHASYLLLNGAQLEGVECVSGPSGFNCTLLFYGPGVLELTEQFYTKVACVNLFAFRQTYKQVQSLVQQGIQDYKDTLKGKNAEVKR